MYVININIRLFRIYALSLTIGITSILSLKFLGMFVGGVLIYLSGRLSSKYY